MEVTVMASPCDFVVELPEGYSDPDMRICSFDQDTFIVTHPERPPLKIDARTHEVTVIEPEKRGNYYPVLW
jgi:hypothetical protein